ncbi:MAG: hypothetical protein H0X26_05360 [Alphaproteobacteria bacterium]|nr:hypothetical protein [Alphaproteobacteria bacterium]
MRKIIFLSLISLIPFTFESLAMEKDLGEGKISTKRKLSSESQQDQNVTCSHSTAKKSKLARHIHSKPINELVNFSAYEAYKCVFEDDPQEVGEKNDAFSITNTIDLQGFKIPIGIAPKLFIKTKKWGKDAGHSVHDNKDGDFENNKKTLLPLRKKEKSVEMIESRKYLTASEKPESEQRIFDLLNEPKSEKNNFFKQNNNSKLLPQKIKSTKGTSFYLPKGSTLKDILK